MSAVTEEEYERVAPVALAALLAALDELGEDVDPELASDVLTIEFSDGARYVVNSHRAARQIWLAAGTRAWHFDYDPGSERWVVGRTGEELWAVLSQQLAGKLGRDVRLAMP